MDGTMEQLKQQHRATWASGDYAEVAQRITAMAEDLVRRAGLAEGMDVLDVATGSGNVAIPAALTGARVTGLDLTPELFEAARRRAAEAGVEVEWVEGDAEGLPYPDASFDRVLSAVGIQFAPRHEVVARELSRVCRPGGRIALANWTPEGLVGGLFRILGSRMPAPPEGVSPPPLWGSEERVRAYFEGTGVELSLERRTQPFVFPSVDEYLDFFEARYGPTLMAKQRLGEAWSEVREETRALVEGLNQATDGSVHVESEYLVVLGEKR